MGRLNAGATRLGRLQRFVAVRFLGASTFASASWKDAERHFERATALDPADPRHPMELGALYLDTDRPDRAAEVLGRAAALTPRSSADAAAVARAQLLLGAVSRGP